MTVRVYCTVHSPSDWHHILPAPCIEPHKERIECRTSLSSPHTTWDKCPGGIVLPTLRLSYNEHCVAGERKKGELMSLIHSAFLEAHLQGIEFPTALFPALVPLNDIWLFPTGTGSNGVNSGLLALQFGQPQNPQYGKLICSHYLLHF